MNILIVAATKEEVNLLLDKLLFAYNKDENTYTLFSENKTDVIISGIGMTAMAFTMGRLKKEYDIAINAGIAGSFNKNYKMGDVVEVTEDIFSELGAEDGERFLAIDNIGLQVQSSKFKVQSLKLENKFLNSLPKVNGITVNTVHGNDASIKKIIERLNPDIESMEGAAFMYACAKLNVPHTQIRAISNFVETREKSKWDIPLAIKNLNNTLIKIVESI